MLLIDCKIEVIVYLNVYPCGTTLHGTMEEADRSAVANRISVIERKLWCLPIGVKQCQSD